ncbi:unnamed protein product [Rotaria sp. Silwood1]|nr:unnamed protein product [Rotaria sp. Silwood1]
MIMKLKLSILKIECETVHGGDGVLLGSASEFILVAMLAARTKKKKVGFITMVNIRQLVVDENYSLRGKILDEYIQVDKEKGLISFFIRNFFVYICGTLGTTSCCSVDNFEKLEQICQCEKLWFHIDGAYAGAALIFCLFLFSNTRIRDKLAVINAMSVDPLYLQHKHVEKATDLRHWSIALSRGFRSLKLWFTIRNYVKDGLRHYIREHCRLSKIFAKSLKTDDRFEIIVNVVFGLGCFHLKGDNILTEKLLSSLNDSGQIHVVPTMLNAVFIIRIVVCAKDALEYDMHIAF